MATAFLPERKTWWPICLFQMQHLDREKHGGGRSIGSFVHHQRQILKRKSFSLSENDLQ